MTDTPDTVKRESVRSIARKSGLTPATVHRFRTGQNVSLQTAAKMRPFVENCPCCGVSNAMPAPRVKPLEWQGPFPANGYKRGRWNAAEFSVVRKGQSYWRVYRNLIDEEDVIYVSEDEAKAAAQADYERRILSALQDTPRVSVAEAARVILEHGAHPEQYAIYGNDRTDRYAKGFCGGVEATIERLRALISEGE